MALIGQIRKNNWLLIGVIGLALFAFILMDSFSGDKSIFGSGQNMMGSVEGVDIDAGEFNRKEQVLYGNSGADYFARRNSLWNYYIEEAIVKKEADALGLGVSKDELMELQFGNRLSPIMQQRYSDPQTRQVNRAQLNQFKQNIESGTELDPNFKQAWRYQEEEIIKERLQSKMNELVTKSVYTPTWMAEILHANQNQKVNFNVVKIPFDQVQDSEIEVTDSDLNAYLNENKSQYVQDEEIRRITYVGFDVFPTSEDSTKWYQGIKENIAAFAEATDDSLFVDNNEGTISGIFAKANEISNVYADTVFRVANGTVLGPFEDAGRYVAVKVLDKKVVPDSVRSRHILIQAKTQNEYATAYQTIDSLKNLIEAGTHRFDSLAVKFSQGPSNVKGGDLGFAGPGGMVKPFNDVIFYQAELGKVYPVVTNFGVHLVEVTDYKYLNNAQGVKLATISQAIIPSEETQKEKHSEVLEFLEANNTSLEALTASVNSRSDLKLENSPPFKRNDFFIGSLESGQTTRDIVRWAFMSDVGEVSPEIYIYDNKEEFFESKYVLTALSGIQDAGTVSLEFARDQIEPIVKNLKKGEVINGKATSKDLNALASTFGVKVDTITGASFSQTFVPGLGSEPKVLSSVFSMDANQTSAPIVGNGGVYIAQVTQKPPAPSASNLPEIRRQNNTTTRGQLTGLLMQALKKKAEVEDNRAKFY